MRFDVGNGVSPTVSSTTTADAELGLAPGRMTSAVIKASDMLFVAA